MQGRDILIYLSLKYEGDWDKIMGAVKNKENVVVAEAEEAVSKIKAHTVTIIDGGYPESLKHAIKPPFVLYYYGNVSLLEDESKCCAYIGSRNASPYGLRMADKLAGGLAEKGYIIVTGLARGIDSEATKAALDKRGKAVGVLGCGIDLCYPSSSQTLYDSLQKNGLVVSEYPGLVPPRPENFPQRNRIVSAVSKGVIVGEASRRSGTLITVSYALGYTKEIGCVPYDAEKESACNSLIKEGAYMVENLTDALTLMGEIPLQANA